MQTYIALLRGINVSGQKKIKMEDLRKLMNAMGFEQVSTYIQSGNIVFRSNEQNSTILEQSIKKKIVESYGFEVSVIIKNPNDFQKVIEKIPFIKDQKKDLARTYITFLSEEPDANLVDQIQQSDYRPEEFISDSDTIYFYSPLGYGRAKMNNNFFEKKLKVSATTRNWKTVNKLWEMGNQLDSQ